MYLEKMEEVAKERWQIENGKAGCEGGKQSGLMLILIVLYRCAPREHSPHASGRTQKDSETGTSAEEPSSGGGRQLTSSRGERSLLLVTVDAKAARSHPRDGGRHEPKKKKAGSREASYRKAKKRRACYDLAHTCSSTLYVL